MLDNVIAHLKSWRGQLAPRSGGEPNAEVAALLREIDKAIGCLAMCANYDLHPKAKVTVLPEPKNLTPSSEFRLMEDQETDSREHWLEVTIDGEPIRPLPGSVLIEP